jgi:hypothetical protein
MRIDLGSLPIKDMEQEIENEIKTHRTVSDHDYVGGILYNIGELN